jgi:hypothetical protein
MSDSDDIREQIQRLEARMDELAGKIERCRKIALLSRAAIVVGSVLLAATIFGLIAFNAVAMLGGIAALLGGIVLLGSNSSTAEQAVADLRAAEVQRAALIGHIELRVVGGSNTIH